MNFYPHCVCSRTTAPSLIKHADSATIFSFLSNPRERSSAYRPYPLYDFGAFGLVGYVFTHVQELSPGTTPTGACVPLSSHFPGTMLSLQ